MSGAAKMQVAFIDIESGAGSSLIKELMALRCRSRIVLSVHDFQRTPSERELVAMYRRMVKMKPDLIKIATYANGIEDNLKILSLVPLARRDGQRIVALCMGKQGKMSRVFAPLIGGAWAYASLSPQKISAPGQLTVFEMREIWKRLS